MGPGLDHHITEWLHPRGTDQNIGRRQQRGSVIAPAEKPHPVGNIALRRLVFKRGALVALARDP